MRKQFFVLVPMLLVSGCADYEAAHRCQDEAGGYPNLWTAAFGVVGAIANEQTAAKQAYNQSMDACIARYKATQNSASSQPSDAPREATTNEPEPRDNGR